MVIVFSLLIGTAYAAPTNQSHHDDTLSPGVYRQIQRVQNHLNQSEIVHAEKLLEKLHQRYHNKNTLDSAMIYQAKGNLHAQRENYGAAITAYEHALAKNKLSPAASTTLVINLGQLYLMEKQSKHAITLLNRWLAEHPRNAPRSDEVYALLAHAYAERENYHKALNAITKALQLRASTNEQKRLPWTRLKISLLLQTEQFSQANQALGSLVQQQPNDAALWQQWWQSALMAEDTITALAIMQMAHKRGMLTQAADFRRLSDLYLTNALPYEAARTLQDALAQSRLPVTATHWLRAAQLYHQAHEAHETIGALKEALTLNPSREQLLTIASISANLHQWDLTLRTAKKARIGENASTATTDEEAVKAAFLIGMAHIQTKDYDSAHALLASIAQNPAHQKTVAYIENHLPLTE